MKNDLRQYLLEECSAMVKHLSAYGKDIPLEASMILKVEVCDFESVDMSEQDVLKLHRLLSKKIAPASPKTVRLLCKESQKSNIFNFLGPVALVRRLMFTALFSLLVFILVSLTKEINISSIESGIYNQNGLSLLIVLIFYLASSSLGASFSNLFQANQYIINNTYDPKFESSYWIRYVLGIIAGIMLAVVIPVPEQVNLSDAKSGLASFADASRPLLAMLGGFSASLVYRILFRMVYAVESIFIGKQSGETDKKLADLQKSNDIEVENGRQQFVNKLLQLQAQVNQAKSTEELDEHIQKVIKEINP